MALRVLLAAALAGCGSTVQVTGAQQVQQPGADGLGGVPAPGQDGLVPGSSGPGAVPSGGVPLGSATNGPVAPGTTGPTTPSAGQDRPGTTTPGQLSGRGITKDSIKVGVGVVDGYDGFVGSLGVNGTSPGDVDAQIQAVLNEINRSGGVLGRKLVAIKHRYNVSQQLANPAAANAAACATWTQDNQVYAVLGPLVVEDTLLGCLARSRTPLLQVGGGVDYPLHYAATYTRFPLFFNLAQMVGDRYDRVAIRRLVQRKFFTPWDTLRGAPGTAPVKVGLVGYDDADGARQIASQVAQLRANGVAMDEGNIVRCPRTLSNCHQSAVLRFSSRQVTHVMGVALLFMNQAESQNYHPRYFVANSARVLAQNAPPRQLVGAMGESYIPSYDVETSEYPGDPTPATTRCRNAMKRGGVDIAEPSVLFNALMVCDAFYFLKAGATSTVSNGASSLVQGLEALGSREPSALTWTATLGPGEHTSARAVRDITFNADKRRWFYDDRVNRSE